MAMRDKMLGTYGFNQFAAGRKRYGGGTTFSPTMGQVDREGYKDREMRNRAKVTAYQRWLKDKQAGKNASSNVLKLQGR